VRLAETQSAGEPVNRMKSELQKYPGEIPLILNVTTPKGETIRLVSKKYRINPTPELIANLREFLGRENVWIEA
jgi:hypothetical protein